MEHTELMQSLATLKELVGRLNTEAQETLKKVNDIITDLQQNV
jgi:uncharacterized protein YoxC